MNPARPRWLTPLQATRQRRRSGPDAKLSRNYPLPLQAVQSGGGVSQQLSEHFFRVLAQRGWSCPDAVLSTAVPHRRPHLPKWHRGNNWAELISFHIFYTEINLGQKRRHKLCLHRVPVPALRMWSQSRTLLVEAGDVHFSRFQKRNKKLSILDV